MAWPHRKEDWPGRFREIKWIFGLIALHLTRSGEMIRLIVQNAKHAAEARQVFQKMGVDTSLIVFQMIRTDRSWLRDTGPIFVERNGELTAADFKFTAWNRYDNYALDDRVAGKMARIAGARTYQPKVRNQRVILEGGAIDSNGMGVLLITEECLLTGETARHPKWDRRTWEQVFRKNLGISRTIWLSRGIKGDDTGGHVDDLAKFVNLETIVAISQGDTSSPDYEALSENLEILGKSGFEIITLPMPTPLFYDGVRLPASYANFYIANEAVLVPVFDDPQDYVAVGILRDIFRPDRAVIPISCRSLVWGFGTIHCALMQEPLIK